MRSAPLLKSAPPAVEEIRQASLARDVQALAAIIERFISTPPADRVDGTNILCALLNTDVGINRFLNDAHWRAVVTVAELNEPDYLGRNALSIMMSADLLSSRKKASFNNSHTGKGKDLFVAGAHHDDVSITSLIDLDESFRQKMTASGFCWGNRHSVAYQFLVYSDKLQLMVKHRDLWGKLTIDFMNVVLTTETFSKTLPVLYDLTHYHDGIKFLAMLPDLVREDGLNETSTYASALMHLSNFPEGVDLLHHASVRKQIQKTALNKIDQRDASSVVSNLAKSPRGCELLAYPDIAKKVEEEALMAKPGHGMPALFHMAKCIEGLSAMANNHCYRSVIQRNDMNLLCRSGENAGTSLLFWLLARKEGCDILLNSWHLRGLIDTSQLLTAAESGEFQGLCPLDFLRKPENQKLLSKLSKDVQAFVKEKVDVSMKRMLSNRAHSGLFLHVEEMKSVAEVPAMQPVEVPQEAEEPRRRLGCTIL